jgi:hypothetical protein
MIVFRFCDGGVDGGGLNLQYCASTAAAGHLCMSWLLEQDLLKQACSLLQILRLNAAWFCASMGMIYQDPA